MSPDSTPPILPPELERRIFEICASSQFSVIPRLMLVAWRVKDWVEPILYRTIMVCEIRRERYHFPRFTPESVAKLLLSKPAAFLRDSVRNLLIHNAHRDLVQSILAICTGVENLWAPEASEVLRPPSGLRLKNLSTNAWPLLWTVSPLDPLFTRLTHLELTGPVHSVAKIASTLPLLPQLTHLAFNDEDLITICPQILDECASLTVLVSRNAGRGHAESLFQGYAERLSRDVRFVLIHSWWFEDWQLGVHSGLDYWARAEDFIAKRRSGEIPATQYELRGLDYWLG
ncbi:hypothetical protein C8R46DRAFT_1361499 [Mycena filopes]|nr:hypothetical protein C8R46DRAFT_1361499 [Mycena filopes]